MKISAIRLQEVGRFRAPVALEGLSGGLDVLAGPNELGKSTILKAVKLALFAKHTSKTKDIEECRPYAGGAPLIEVDFEIGGVPWRIRKQYLSARAAELKNLRSGEIARGGDAETQLARLMAETGRFALLWVGQGGALQPVNPAAAAGRSLIDAVEAEVESVADGGAAREVLALVKAELGELVTGHAPPRPTGRYKAALDARDELQRQAQEAEARLAKAQARLAQLARLRDEAQALSEPTAAARRSEAAEVSARAFQEAAEAHQKLRQAEEATRAHEERLAALKAQLEGIEGKITDLAKLEEAQAHAGPLLADAAARVRAAEAKESEWRKRCGEIKTALAAAEAERKALIIAARLSELQEHLNGARAASGRIKALAAEIEGNGADDELIGAVRREAQVIATLKARLSAAAPTVSIAYAEGGAGRIRLGGRPLAEGETLSPRSPIALEIAGIGVLTIAPGRAEGIENDEAELAQHSDKLEGLLQRVPAASAEDAEARARARRELLAERIEAQSQLKAHAPQGLAALERTHDELSARLPDGAAPAQNQAEIEARVHELTAELAAGETELVAAQRVHAQLREEALERRTRAEERQARIGALTADLGDEAQRAAKREKATAAVAECEGALNRAVRDRGAWREKAPDAARLAALQTAAETARTAKADAERKLTELRWLEAGIEGELKADRADDVEARLAELKESAARAEARVAGFAEEIAAAQLLARELEAAEGETRDRFAKPVIARLAPYLDLVFPEARARLGQGFGLEALERAGVAEALSRLSEGTQEQLAVLVRLGLARLLAESGTRVPLILDDALVYSDDTRIERMFKALKLAAEQHQVVVLTCRERTFAGLEGNRIAIEPWHPA